MPQSRASTHGTLANADAPRAGQTYICMFLPPAAPFPHCDFFCLRSAPGQIADAVIWAAERAGARASDLREAREARAVALLSGAHRRAFGRVENVEPEEHPGASAQGGKRSDQSLCERAIPAHSPCHLSLVHTSHLDAASSQLENSREVDSTVRRTFHGTVKTDKGRRTNEGHMATTGFGMSTMGMVSTLGGTFKDGEDRLRSTNTVAILDVPEPVRSVASLSCSLLPPVLSLREHAHYLGSLRVGRSLVCPPRYCCPCAQVALHVPLLAMPFLSVVASCMGPGTRPG